MKIYRKLVTATTGIIALFLVTGPAPAQGLEEKMTVTFSAPVEIPGEVLPAGKYVFEVLQQGTLTRILNADETHVYATVLTVPDEQREPADGGSVVLKKNDQGGPERIGAWFLPGNPVGSEFVYPQMGHKTFSSEIDNAGKDVEHATDKAAKDTAKDIGDSSEYIGVHAAHAGEDVGKTIYHAGKSLVP